MTDLKPCPFCGALPCDWVDNPHTRATSPATLQVPDPDVRERRHNALATAFALLASFAGDGLAHVYGNGQTLDASDVCVELAAAFGMEAEPGWERRVAAILAALPLDGREGVERCADVAKKYADDLVPHLRAEPKDEYLQGEIYAARTLDAAIRKLVGEGE